MKLYVQQAGQAVQEVSLSSSTNIHATPGTRLFIEGNNGHVSHMARNGSGLIINTSDGNVVTVDNFFGPADQGLSSLTIENTPESGLPEKQIVLGDERVYNDGAEVVAYTPEQLKDIISGWDYYEVRGEEAAAAGDDDNTGLFVALGLGAAGVAGLIAWAANDDDDDNDHSSSNPAPTPDPSEVTDPTTLTLNRSNGSSLSGTCDAKNATVYIDVNSDGHHDFATKTDANGNWSFTPATPIADGATVTVWVVNSKGEKIPVSTQIDATAPEAESIVVSQDLNVISGKTEPGAKVKLDVDGDGKADYEVTADENGNYKITLNEGQTLVPGTSVISLADDLGNTASVTLPGSHKASVLGMGEDGQSMDLTATTDVTSPTIHGRGVPGSTVNLLDGGKVIGTAEVDAKGNWSIKVENLDAGKHNFDVQTVVGTKVTESGKDVSVTYEQKAYDMSVANSDVREIETDGTIDAPISITRALPNGGYLVAYPEAESAGSKYYDIKIKIFDAAGNLTNTLTLGDKNVADGYSKESAQKFLSNFDVAVSPTDGAITVLYAKNDTAGSYTGHDVVYERFTAEGTPITSGPQMVSAHNDLGGANGILKEWLPDGIADQVTGFLSSIVNPIADFLTNALKTLDFLNVLPNTDFKALVDGLVNTLPNHILSAIIGQGAMSSSIVQMPDGSVVFTGTHTREFLDLENLNDNLDISGLVRDLCKALGLSGIPIIGQLIDTVTELVLTWIKEPIKSIEDFFLKLIDTDAFELGSHLYSYRYAEDANGNLVKVSSNIETPTDTNFGGFLDENGYITTNNGVFDTVVNFLFGTNPGSDTEGLAGAGIGNNQYAVVWQQGCKDWSLDKLLSSSPVDLKLSVVDFKTGKIVLDGAKINTNAPAGSTDIAPKIVALDDGTFLVSWVRATKGDGGDVMVQRFEVLNDQLHPLSDAIVANQSTDGTQGLMPNTLTGAYDISVLENGNYVVTWASNANGESHVMARVYDASGAPVTGELVVDKGVDDEGTCSLPSVTSLADGGFAVTWSEVSNGDSNLYSRTYNGDGTSRYQGDNGDVSKPGEFIEGNYHSAEGTAGNDVIDGRNGVSNVNAGDGDDRILVDSHKFSAINGSDGFDTVVFHDQSGTTIGSDVLSKLHSIEQIDLNSTSALQLDVSYNDLIKLNDDKKLFINGTSDDKVDLDLTSWSNVATANKGGVEYNLYVYDKDEDAQIWVQNGVSVI
ncbi:Uncharacterised protein [Leminorella grimontii]|nr:Uncharacterised protein [Leminorella grimontii]